MNDDFEHVCQTTSVSFCCGSKQGFDFWLDT